MPNTPTFDRSAAGVLPEGIGRQGRWRAAEAQAVVQAWKASCLKMTAFCAREGIHIKRLQRWSSVLRRGRGLTAPAMQFLPVQLSGPAQACAATGESNAAVDVRLPSGAWLSVRPGFDRSALKELVEILGC